MSGIMYKNRPYVGGGGSGSGDTVNVTPTLSTGTKVADIEVNGITQSLYAPTPPDDIDDLSDVVLSSPADGQVLKYDSTSQKWVNANESGGGGGTTVIANPSGTPTATLNTIQIGNTIYSLPLGGGGEIASEDYYLGGADDNLNSAVFDSATYEEVTT